MTEDSSEDIGKEDETASTSDGERYVDLVDTLEELEATPIDQRLQFLGFVDIPLFRYIIG